MPKVSGMSKLNILNLATTDERGAGIASRYFNELFIAQGYNSVLVVKKSNQRNNNVIVIQNYSSKYSFRFLFYKIRNSIHKKLKHIKTGQLNSKYCFYNTNENKKYISAKKIIKNTPFNPDIIILHWVTDFINAKSIKKLVEITNAKIFWIMMDNAPLTGGCHYPWNCIGFHSDCSNCPAIVKESKKYIASQNLKNKKDHLPNNIEIITCSEFDYLRAMKSDIFIKNKIHKILFPVDEHRFKPGDKTLAKLFFNINHNKKVIFYGTLSLNDTRKGGKYFLETLSFLKDMLIVEGKNLDEFLIFVAGVNGDESFNHIGFPILKTGYLNEDSLIKAYQAADIFVSTSIEDSGPTTVKQSIMCGTPVASFEMGIALDLVISKGTGYLAKLKDSKDLAEGIKNILNIDKISYQNMSMNCRKLGLSLYNSVDQTNKFLKILNNI